MVPILSFTLSHIFLLGGNSWFRFIHVCSMRVSTVDVQRTASMEHATTVAAAMLSVDNLQVPQCIHEQPDGLLAERTLVDYRARVLGHLGGTWSIAFCRGVP